MTRSFCFYLENLVSVRDVIIWVSGRVLNDPVSAKETVATAVLDDGA